jgi:type II secretory pathway pseudopilin PulG
MDRMRAANGMTILEVLVATMVLAVVSFVIFSAFAIGLRATALAGGMQTATGLAEEALATVTASPCGSSFRLASQVSQPMDAALNPRLARFDRAVTVKPSGRSGLYEITATVAWTQERARRHVTLTTWRHISAACAFVGQ